MNTLKLVDFFQIIAAVATAIAAYLTYKTLKEVKKQRESMYMPDIIIEEKRFYIYTAKKNDISSFCEFTLEKKDQNYTAKEFKISKLQIDIFNIGLATAKNIKVTFKFDIDKAISIIEKMNKNMSSEKAINIIKTRNGIEFKGGTKSIASGSVHFTKNQLHSTINHVLPINISNSSYKIELPQFILELYSNIISQFWILDSKTIEMEEFPLIEINFTFFDIGNKKHKKKYQLCLKFDGGSNSESWNSIKII